MPLSYTHIYMKKDRPAVRFDPFSYGAPRMAINLTVKVRLLCRRIRYAPFLPVETAVVVTDFLIPVPGQKESGRLAQKEYNEPLQVERPDIVSDARKDINQNQKGDADRHIDRRNDRLCRLYGKRNKENGEHADGSDHPA